MALEIYHPSPPLSDHVEMLWCWRGYRPPHNKERILPGGMMEITINLTGEGFRTQEPDGQAHHIKEIMVTGARSEYFLVDTSRPTDILAVWFKPGGALTFFDAAGDALHNQQIELGDVWGHEAHTLYCRLLEAPSTRERFRILEAALLRRLYHARETHRAVQYALSVFRQQSAAQQATAAHTAQAAHIAHISHIVDQIALSPTRFIQVFRQETGLTPKLYSRIQRFQEVLRQIARARLTSHAAPDWADLALASGYYDQSHLIHDFQAFAGLTPTRYQPQSPDHLLNMPEE